MNTGCNVAKNAWLQRPVIPQPHTKLLVDMNQWNWVWGSNRELSSICTNKDKFIAHQESLISNAKAQTARALHVNKKIREENQWATQLLKSLRETVGEQAWMMTVDAHITNVGLPTVDCDLMRAVLAPRAVSPKPFKALLPEDAVIQSPSPRKKTLNDNSPCSSFEWIADMGFEQPTEFPPTSVEVTEEAFF